MQRCDLPFPVKRINGTNSYDVIFELNFYNADNSKSARIQSHPGYPLAADCYLDDKEEIIGVYGVKNVDNYFY